MSKLNVAIQGRGSVIEPVVLDRLRIRQEWQGTAGSLDLTLLDDGELEIELGDPVQVTYEGTVMFSGFVFQLGRSASDEVEVRAYDQLRYLKNKDTYVFEDKTASEIIQMIAEDFALVTGEIADTGHKMTKVEDNVALGDMIASALAETTRNTGKLYVLYDDAGELTLKDITSLQAKILIDQTTAEDYDYSATIDGDTANKIKLVRENPDTGAREIFISQDSENIGKWGVLQRYATLQKEEDGGAKAQKMLELYNRPHKTIRIRGAFGDPTVRAGSLIPVVLDMHLDKIQNYMLVESCTHVFDGEHHSMDLDLRGGAFS